MANIKKSFNFRNGFQVDDDNVVINSNGLVGIGTTVPLEALDVYGNVRVSGVASVGSLFSSSVRVVGFVTFTNGSIGLASFTSSGIVTATTPTGILTYYGDGSKLLNLPTSQWLDVDTGIGYTSIFAQGNVGISTIYPIFPLQVGGVGNDIEVFSNGFGVNSSGDVYTTGVITSTAANGGFVGDGSLLTDLNASSLSSGTISDLRLPTIPNEKLSTNVSVVGSITAPSLYGDFIGTVYGSLTGIADTANDLSSTANISITQVTAGFATCGLTTVSKLDIRNTSTNSGTIGINTQTHRSDLHIVKTAGISSVLLTSSPNEVSLITLGRNFSTQSGGLRFGKSSTVDLFNYEKYSNGNSLDVINYDTSNLNYYISNSNARFHWMYRTGVSDATPLMTLTSNGKLIVGSATTTAGEETLRVTGILTVTNSSNAFFDKDVNVKGNLNVYGSTNFNIDNKNLNVTTGVSTVSGLNVLSQLSLSGGSSYDVLSNASLIIGDWKNEPRTDCTVLADGIGVGIGTTAIRNITVGGISTSIRLDALQAYSCFRSISVGSATPSSLVDFGSPGSNVNSLNPYRFMIVPKLSNNNITSLTPSSGGLVYDTSNNVFRGYNGTAWTSLVAAGSTASKTYPQNNVGSGDYTLATSDIGKHISIQRTGGSTTVTIPNNLGASVGDTIIIYNASTTGQTDIAVTHQTSSNLLFAGGNVGIRSMTQYAVATLLCVSTSGSNGTFVIYGEGVS